jgi:Transposase DDE domain
MSNLVKMSSIAEELGDLFTDGHLMALARRTGFVKRSPRKIDPKSFLMALFLRITQGTNTLSSLAMNIGMFKGMRISKQAISKRMRPAVVQYLQGVLAQVIAQRFHGLAQAMSLPFARILIQDSTTVRLPSHLASAYPGNSNQRKTPIALVKVQAVYNILQEQFCSFWISPFTVNDQRIATTMLEFVHQGDLLIRDLGYFVIEALRCLELRGAYFLTRLRYGTRLTSPDDGKQVRLLKLLKKHPYFDGMIIVGARETLKVRLVAIPIDPVVAAQRRRALKSNRDHRLNPSREHLALLGWNLFLLNVSADILPAKTIAALYGLRWRIETIFKAWKSHFHLARLESISVIQVEVHLYAFFIFVTLFHSFVSSFGNNGVVEQSKQGLSLLKLYRCFKDQFAAIVLYTMRPAVLYDQLTYHCSYETRHDRRNYHQAVLALG